MELALDANAPSKPHILNLLARLTGEAPPAPVDAPPGLTLQAEPVANVERYDDFRRTHHVAHDAIIAMLKTLRLACPKPWCY
ncbi:hypothetical protein OKW40_004366 [Paraburkholderia sp. RAU6.4a]|uniref:hypothetical protein n=1 Tax=Paraburkholderia sp. RAU6.4a TaxID=2991067 RepID=UPI003D1A714E